MNEVSVTSFFQAYQRLHQAGMDGNPDLDKLASMYADHFIMSSPEGINIGSNDNGLRGFMQAMFARQHEMGERDLLLKNVDISNLDGRHCVAKVTWGKSYESEGEGEGVGRRWIEFEMNYLVGCYENDVLRVFGWTDDGSEDESLAKYGLSVKQPVQARH